LRKVSSNLIKAPTLTRNPLNFRHQLPKVAMKNLRKYGFSLVELVIVIAVIAVISAIIIPTVSGTNEAAKDQKAIAAAEALNMAQVQYRLQNGAAWTVTSNDDRYAALKAYMTYAQDTLTLFEANIAIKPVYTFEFQDFTTGGQAQKVILKKNGTKYDY
jgi:prepilin-type N-terminal cleavage/methylation domain-containing protein